MKSTIQLIGAAVLGSALTLGAGAYIAPSLLVKEIKVTQAPMPAVTTAFNTSAEAVAMLDFSIPAERTTPSVVHIKSTSSLIASGGQQNPQMDLFRDFFGEGFMGPQQRRSPSPRQSTGSGVVVSNQGHIVTNNHVVEGAEEVEVALYDNRTFKAKVIGTDPSTDLAVIQIKDSEVPAIAFGNSDDVKVGNWVLAIGNPFNLSSTVTAGVVSAKGRNINILRTDAPIESFIQTDAAVNPGNSGGALVNLNGELIGINTAISSPTGSYAGYAFAVPSNIVQKVVEDLIKFGVVQRGFLGITIRDVNAQLAREKDLKVYDGVYVDSVLAEGSAYDAGIKAGDVISKVDGLTIKTRSDLTEQVGRKRPGDKLEVVAIRNGKEKTFKVALKNKEGKTSVVAKEELGNVQQLGVELADLDENLKKKLDLKQGVQVKKIKAGKIQTNTDMREGFIITSIDKTPVNSVKEVEKILNSKSGGVMIEGVYPDFPGTYYYAFGL